MARTREQIIADCEAAYRSLEEELNLPANRFPCKTCRWYSTKGHDGYAWGKGYEHHHTCTHPLVRGKERGKTIRGKYLFPCGEEKALWESRPTCIERIKNFFA